MDVFRVGLNASKEDAKTTVFRSTDPVNNLHVSHDHKWLAIALENDGEVCVVDIDDTARVITLDGHSNTIKNARFSPTDLSLVTSSADGTIRIWKDEDNEWGSCKVIRDVIDRLPVGSTLQSAITWSANGSRFAVCGKRQEVVVVSADGGILYRLKNPEDNSLLSFSPSSKYLLTIGGQGHLRVWRPDSSRDFPVINDVLSSAVSSACWAPDSRNLCFVEDSGKMFMINHPILLKASKQKASKLADTDQDDGVRKKMAERLKHKAKSVSSDSDDEESSSRKTKSSRKLVGLDGGFVDDEADESDADVVRKPIRRSRDDDEIFDQGDDVSMDEVEEQDEENGGKSLEKMFDEDEDDLNDFIEDDDGAGYIEDIKDQRGYRKYHERSRANGIRALQRQTDVVQPIIPDSFIMDRGGSLQKAFQPGSTPSTNSRRYLAFNLLGTICSADSETHSTIDVSFHDKSRRAFHFTDHYNYSIAVLGEFGAAFACESAASTPSTIYFRPSDSVMNSGDWTIQLNGTESAKSIAVTKWGVVVATDLNYLRFYSYGGLQTKIRCLPGPVVSMAGSDRFLFVVYHSGSVLHGEQAMSCMLLDLDRKVTLVKDRLPISPGSQLKWIGFSDKFLPMSYDSSGVLRGLFMSEDAAWVPLLDVRIALPNKQQDTCWCLGVSDGLFMFVLCKGSDGVPSFPTPLINEISLQVPFSSLDVSGVQYEETWYRKSIFYQEDISQQGINYLDDDSKRMQETEMDKAALHLVLAACKNEKSQRALDVCSLFHSMKSFEGAIKLAIHHHLPALAEKMNAIKETRYLEEKRKKQEEDAMVQRPQDGRYDAYGEMDGVGSYRQSRWEDSRNIDLTEGVFSTHKVQSESVLDEDEEVPVVVARRSKHRKDRTSPVHAEQDDEMTVESTRDESHLDKTEVIGATKSNKNTLKNPFAKPAGSRNPFSVSSFSEQPTMNVPQPVGLKLFEAIKTAVNVEQKGDFSNVGASGSKDLQGNGDAKKRKQVTLLNMFGKPSSTNDELDAKNKKMKPMSTPDTVAAASSSTALKLKNLDSFVHVSAAPKKQGDREDDESGCEDGDVRSEDQSEAKENVEPTLALQKTAELQSPASVVGKGKRPIDEYVYE